MTEVAEAARDCRCCKRGTVVDLSCERGVLDPLCMSCMHLWSDHETSLLSFPAWNDDGIGDWW